MINTSSFHNTLAKSMLDIFMMPWTDATIVVQTPFPFEPMFVS